VIHRKLITSITAVLLPFVTFLLTLPLMLLINSVFMRLHLSHDMAINISTTADNINRFKLVSVKMGRRLRNSSLFTEVHATINCRH
jgi:hypothetical protein